MGDEFSRDGQAQRRNEAAAAAEKAKETAAKTPDTKAEIALVGVDVAQTQTLDLAGQLTPPSAPGKAADPAPAAASATPETPAAPETPVEPEKGFFDSVPDWFSNLGTRMGTLPDDISKYFAQETKDKPDFLDRIALTLSTGVFAVTDFFKKLFNMEDAKAESRADTKPDAKSDLSFPEVSVPQVGRLLAYAKGQLEALRADPEKKTWVDYAKEIEQLDSPSYGGVPASTILAISHLESGFNPGAKPVDPDSKAYLSSAVGLGQFIDGTWAGFQAENPEFKDAARTNPKASLAAIAWYAKKNGRECGFDATDPSCARFVYEAHFVGSEGFRRVQSALKGEVLDPGLIPSSYRDHRFPSFGVDEPISTYSDYAHLATVFGARVQSVANLYQAELSPAIS